jgi:hypothetical protein
MQLSEQQAALMQERVQDFVVYCEPRCKNPQEWSLADGRVRVSNAAHPHWTQLTIRGEPPRQGELTAAGGRNVPTYPLLKLKQASFTATTTTITTTAAAAHLEYPNDLIYPRVTVWGVPCCICCMMRVYFHCRITCIEFK